MSAYQTRINNRIKAISDRIRQNNRAHQYIRREDQSIVRKDIYIRCEDSGQTTAEYALVIIGAAAIALLLLTWATGTGTISDLFDRVVGSVANNV